MSQTMEPEPAPPERIRSWEKYRIEFASRDALARSQYATWESSGVFLSEQAAALEATALANANARRMYRVVRESVEYYELGTYVSQR